MISSRRSGSEHGSISLTLVASIVLAGIVVVLFAQVTVGQRTARDDRDYSQAVQVADAGLQAAFTQLANLDYEDPSLPAVGETVTGVADVEEGAYSWTARRVGFQRWEVRSEGAFLGRTRFVEAAVGPRQLFQVAMFGDLQVGANGASAGGGGSARPAWHTGGDSGRFTTFNSDNDNRYDDKELKFGTNNMCDLKGNLPDNLIAIGFGTGPHPGCDGSEGNKLEFEDLGAKAFASGGVCASKAPELAWPSELVHGEKYCFPASVTPVIHINPGQYMVTGNPANGPAEVYIEGTIAFLGSGETNVKSINVDPTPAGRYPQASSLIMLFAGEGTLSTRASQDNETANNNHVHWAAAIYAPNRACSFGAQTLIYGAITCNQIETLGGFNFWYDETTARLTMDEYFAISSWREETAASSGFDWGS